MTVLIFTIWFFCELSAGKLAGLVDGWYLKYFHCKLINKATSHTICPVYLIERSWVQIQLNIMAATPSLWWHYAYFHEIIWTSWIFYMLNWAWDWIGSQNILLCIDYNKLYILLSYALLWKELRLILGFRLHSSMSLIERWTLVKRYSLNLY